VFLETRKNVKLDNKKLGNLGKGPGEKNALPNEFGKKKKPGKKQQVLGGLTKGGCGKKVSWFCVIASPF